VESFFTASLHISDFIQTQNEAKILTQRLDVPLPPLSQPSNLQKSTRVKTQPRYLQNYHYQLASSSPSLSSSTAQNSGIPYSLSNYISYNHLSPAYKHFCSSISAQSNLFITMRLLSLSLGVRLCQLRFQLWRLIILGLFVISHLINIQSGVSGFIKSNIELMVVLKVIRLG
jgi:hypothetical protein